MQNDLKSSITANTTRIIFPYGNDSFQYFDESMAISNIGAKGIIGIEGLTRIFYKDFSDNIRAFSYFVGNPILDVKLRF